MSDTEKIETSAGIYTVKFVRDEYPEKPYNDGLGFAYVGHCNTVDAKDGKHADEVLSILKNNGDGWYANGVQKHRYSSAAIARYLRIAYGLKGIRVVDYDYNTSAPTGDRTEKIYGIAWASDDATYPSEYTDAAIAEYRAWADGDVYGWVVKNPSGEHVDSCWGYYGLDGNREHMLSEAHASIMADATERRKNASLVGAGFIGII